MNLLVYIVRSGAFDWATKFLVERRGIPVGRASAATAAFELLGIPGSLLAGIVSDRLLAGRRAPVCVLFMLMSALGVLCLYLVPSGSATSAAIAMGFLGMAIYGPQFLVGVFATDLASPKAAATAIGLTGVFGYAGSALSGAVTGVLIDRTGWSAAFLFWGGASLVGALLAIPLWNTRGGSAKISH